MSHQKQKLSPQIAIVFSLLCFAILVVFFKIGHRANPRDTGQEQVEAKGDSADGGKKLTAVSRHNPKTSPGGIQAAARVEFSPAGGRPLEDLIAELDRAAGQNRLNFDATTLASIAELGKEAFPEIVTENIARLDGAARKPFLIAALGRWADFEPQAAAEFAVASFSGHEISEALAAVFLSWGASDPQAALAWFKELDRTGSLSSRTKLASALSKLYYAWAKQDPSAAGAATTDLPGSGTFYAWIGISGLTTDDALRDSALAATEEVEDEAARNKALSRMVGEWAEHDPAAAAAWLDDNGKREPKIEWAISQRWERIDPVSSADWLTADRSDKEALEKNLSQALTGWSMSDVEAAAAWLDKFGPTDGSIAIIANGYSSIDLKKSIEWAQRASEEKLDEVIIGALAEAKMRDGEVDLKPYLGAGILEPEAMAEKVEKRFKQLQHRF